MRALTLTISSSGSTVSPKGADLGAGIPTALWLDEIQTDKALSAKSLLQ